MVRRPARLMDMLGFDFRQADREESLVHLLRVNVLKRMESAVPSFALPLGRQLADVEATLARIEAHAESVDEIDIEDVDVDDPAFESLLVGRKVKVLLQDVDRVRWRQDLIEDRNRLATLLSAANQVGAARDAKLAALRETIEGKCRDPLNPGNRKVLVFTAFADTAQYLYREVAPWALKDFIQADPLLRPFFDVFLFEDLPASGRRADQVYLDEVDRCDVYVGLFGNDYGYEDAAGVSPTEREFDRATATAKERLVFVKGDDSVRHAKMQALVRKAGN